MSLGSSVLSSLLVLTDIIIFFPIHFLKQMMLLIGGSVRFSTLPTPPCPEPVVPEAMVSASSKCSAKTPSKKFTHAEGKMLSCSTEGRQRELNPPEELGGLSSAGPNQPRATNTDPSSPPRARAALLTHCVLIRWDYLQIHCESPGCDSVDKAKFAPGVFEIQHVKFKHVLRAPVKCLKLQPTEQADSKLIRS